MAEEPGELSRLLYIHYDQPGRGWKQIRAACKNDGRAVWKIVRMSKKMYEFWFLPRWILLQAAFTRSFSQYYRPGENRGEVEVTELT